MTGRARGLLTRLCLWLTLALGLALLPPRPGLAQESLAQSGQARESAVLPDAAQLIAEIESAGQHATALKRHSVRVSGCTMTTEFLYNHPSQGWVLWSRFVVFMPDATPRARGTQTGHPQPGQEQAGNDPHRADQPSQEAGITAFRMRPGTTARYERSSLRRHLADSRASPRGDGTTHRLSRVEKFFIQHDGPGSAAKAHRFTEAYKTYTRHYCAFIG